MPWTELGNERGGSIKTQRHLPPEALPSELDVVLQLAELVRLDRLVPRHDHLPHELPAKPRSIRTCSNAQRMWVEGRRTWRNFPSCNPAVDRGRSAHRRLSRTYMPKCSYLLASHRVILSSARRSCLAAAIPSRPSKSVKRNRECVGTKRRGRRASNVG